MKKDMKKIVLSLIMALSIVLSQIAYIPLKVNAEGNDSVNVTVRVEGLDGTILQKTSVNVTKESPVVLDAIEKVIGNRITTSPSPYGGVFIESIDDIGTKQYPNGGWMYQINNDSNVVGVDSQPIKEGNNIVLYLVEGWDSKYSYFDKEEVSVEGNKSVELTLTSQGYDESWNTVLNGVENANIIINNQKTDLFTDKDGKITIPADKFEQNGDYIITAEKKENGKYQVSRPYSKITVTGKDTQGPIIENPQDGTNVTVRVEGLDKTILQKTNVNITKESPVALDAIEKVIGNRITTSPSPYGGVFIESIDNIGTKQYPSGGWMYQINNDSNVVGVDSQPIKEGNNIVLYLVEGWDSKYSYFDRDDVLVEGNKSVELTLISQGYDESWNSVLSGVENANIIINNQKTDLFTDKDGKITIPADKFAQNGDYIITAEKKENGKYIISRPYSKITVNGKDTQAPIINPKLKDTTVYSSKYTLDVTTTDNADKNIVPKVKLNGNEINPGNDGKYTITLNEGINTISIYAKDSSNNESTKTISITYKKLSIENYNLLEEMNLTAKHVEGNNLDEWSAISLNKLGIKGSKEYFDYMVNNFNKNVPKKGLDYYTNVELEKLIMYLASQGYTPYNFNGYDLVKELFNRDVNKFDVMDVMFGMFVYDYCNISDSNYKIKLNDLKNALLDKSFTDSNGNLGWSLSGKAPIKPDLVGFAVLALSNWQDDSSIKTTIDKAVSTLSNVQTESGCYYDGFSGGESSEAVSVAILGLTSVGIDPTDTKFTKNGNSLITALMSFKGTNGQYKHLQDGGNDYMATEEALRALISLNEFYKNGKYNYYDSDINAKELAVYGKNENDTKEEPTKDTGSKPTTNNNSSNNNSNNNSSEDENTSTVVKDTEDEVGDQSNEELAYMGTTAINENKDVKDTSKSNKSKLPITSGIITLATGAIAAGAYFMFRKDF
jgi:sporulation protein YlmC with PRC-barrel domain